MSIDKLTQKQELFCNYYVECGANASEAYRRAYDVSKMKDESINVNASKLRANTKVAQRIKALQAELKETSDISKQRILQELEAILDAKITDYLDFDGTSIKFKNFKNLSEKQIRAIEGVKNGTNGIEIKLYGKSWTIERICKMLGYDAPQHFEGDLIDKRVQTSLMNEIPVKKLKEIRKVVNEE